jgi:hypothetical protein
MRLLLALCLAGCTVTVAENDVPHDMTPLAPTDMTMIDLSPPRDGPVYTTQVGGCSFSASSRP